LNKNKAIGYALIIVGLVLGIEGTAFTFAGTWALGQVNQAIALSSVLNSQSGGIGAGEFFQGIQSLVLVFIVYSLLKTVGGIACMLFGYSVLKSKK